MIHFICLNICANLNVKLNGFFMLLKTSFTSFIFLWISSACISQDFELEEKKSVNENGFEYEFIINNEQIKEAKGEEYSRYEITLYVTNNSGCSKIYSDKKGFLSGEDHSLLATFNCRNATGKRWTVKSAGIRTRDFYITVKHKVNDKDTTETVKAGYIFRNGETIKSNIIVLVPKGERPQMACAVNNPPEMQ
jgi:hypothetical protein